MEREAARSLQRAGPGMMEMREAMAMSLVVASPDQRQARRSARQELVRQVELGATASEARRRCPVPMHRTTVYRLLKRVGQEGEQAFSERRHGHPVKLRGEVLNMSAPTFLERYEQQVQTSHVARMIVDREGMATEFLARLHAEGRIVVTILQTNQYRDLSSFSKVGSFEPLSTDTRRKVIREVAPARITLPREEHPDEPLCLQVALIRDLRRRVEAQSNPEEAGYPRRWDRDLSLEEQAWWRDGWQATAAPAKEKVAKLIPIVTTETMPTIDAVELAQTYIHRWPAQENVIKDYLRPLGLDTNHGFANTAVENSEVTKRRTHLEQRLARLKQSRPGDALRTGEPGVSLLARWTSALVHHAANPLHSCCAGTSQNTVSPC